MTLFYSFKDNFQLLIFCWIEFVK